MNVYLYTAPEAYPSDRTYHIMSHGGLQCCREFTKPRRQRRRERHQTKGLMSYTMAVHVRFEFWYISLPSSADQQRKMTKFCVAWRKLTTTTKFQNFYLIFIAVFRIEF